MLRNRLFAAAIAVSSLALFAVGCGSDTTEQKPTPEPEKGVAPPEEPTGLSACAGSPAVMAMSHLYLGDTTWEGTADPTNGWKNFGYDLDGVVSTKESTGLCKPAANASPAAVYPDGLEGRDNSFGKNILKIILGLSSDISTSANEAIEGGEFTIMLAMDNVATGKDCNGVNTKLYGGANMMMAPKWDGTDQWPLLPALLSNPDDPTSAKIQFPNSYVVGNTWVSGTKGTVALSLSISGFSITLNINSAVITIDLADDLKSGTKGTIAGVIETEALIEEISKVAAAFDDAFCDPNSQTLQTILNQLRQASDIMKDGTQNAASTCDGISIGLGFDAKAVQLGPVAPPPDPAPDPCAPAMP